MMPAAALHDATPEWLFDLQDRLIVADQPFGPSSNGWSYAPARRCDAVPEGMSSVPLRQAFALLGESRWVAAGAALQRLRFHEQHRYCARCSGRMDVATEGARQCVDCSHVVWPPISPAVIVLVVRGREVLLARHRGHAHGRHTGLAGFVAPGETLEQCVAREVAEECGVSLESPRYIASQPWPFPHSLMCGFVARWAGGEPVPDGDELVEAAWFDVDALPALPDPPALVHRLLEAVRSGALDR